MSKLGSAFTFEFLAVNSSKLDLISMYFNKVFSRATSTCDKAIIIRDDATLVRGKATLLHGVNLHSQQKLNHWTLKLLSHLLKFIRWAPKSLDAKIRRSQTKFALSSTKVAP
jgi:hypothetical protein